MDKIVFLLKTYRGDLKYYKRLIDTFVQFNADKIPLYVVVPKKDRDLFMVEYENINIICEEDIPGLIRKEDIPFCSFSHLTPGYLNQQIVKLAFWELGLCENYFCIDADCYFIRFFHKSDFIYRSDIPYTVFFDDVDLMSDPEYYRTHGRPREKYNRIIRSAYGIADEVRLCSSHGFSIISGIVMDSLKREYMKTKDLQYSDLLLRAPIEFTWYNYWLITARPIEIYQTTPFMKTYHTEKQLKTDIKNGISENNLRRNYLGIVINSNFGKNRGIWTYREAYEL